MGGRWQERGHMEREDGTRFGRDSQLRRNITMPMAGLFDALEGNAMTALPRYRFSYFRKPGIQVISFSRKSHLDRFPNGNKWLENALCPVPDQIANVTLMIVMRYDPAIKHATSAGPT
jgi:hypothetical protein